MGVLIFIGCGRHGGMTTQTRAERQWPSAHLDERRRRIDADCIVVLRDGRILEQGSHDELMQIAGLYFQLYTSAHGSFDDQATDASVFATRT